MNSTCRNDELAKHKERMLKNYKYAFDLEENELNILKKEKNRLYLDCRKTDDEDDRDAKVISETNFDIDYIRKNVFEKRDINYGDSDDENDDGKKIETENDSRDERLGNFRFKLIYLYRYCLTLLFS
jgi:hypothetical protein